MHVCYNVSAGCLIRSYSTYSRHFYLSGNEVNSRVTASLCCDHITELEKAKNTIGQLEKKLEKATNREPMCEQLNS